MANNGDPHRTGHVARNLNVDFTRRLSRLDIRANTLMHLRFRALLLPQCFHGCVDNVSTESKRPLTYLS